MAIVDDLPQRVRRVDHLWIALPDGTRLAARLWLPEEAEAVPVPGLLIAHPYRKSDRTAVRNQALCSYLADHGYAVVRLDLRGSGDSDGVLYDEYLPQEQDDLVAVIAWMAAQPWCSGEVGMLGTSWGGFNSLQVAARRPPALKAIISNCSTDDRYADDVHYMGGCVIGQEMPIWASVMLGRNALPPLPSVYGPSWRAAWLQRLRETPPYIDAWLGHQRRDAYWRHGSICENYAAIACPVFMTGGWADGYSNAIMRTLAGLAVPCKGLIGPWAHGQGQHTGPGPLVGYLQECLRWFDYWLKGRDTGIMDEPLLRVWLQNSVPPATSYVERPGRWVAETVWPPQGREPQRLFLASTGQLGPAPDTSLTARVATALGHGLDTQMWCPYGAPGDFANDQRREDGLALTFTSAALGEATDLLGYPVLHVEVAADQPLAQLAVRLCDVAPDGASTLVSFGLLNLTHRDSHAQPTLLVPGQRYQLRVALNAIGHRIAAGHRWRVALAPSYWPMAWPAPQPVTLTIYGGAASYLELPVRPPTHADDALAALPPPEEAPALPFKRFAPARVERSTTYDRLRACYTLRDHNDSGRICLCDSDIVYGGHSTVTWSIVEGDPLSAHVRCQHALLLSQHEWEIRVVTDSVMWADATHFYLCDRLDAFEGAERVFQREWSRAIPRDLV
jgi:uncharacterized protein